MKGRKAVHYSGGGAYGSEKQKAPKLPPGINTPGECFVVAEEGADLKGHRGAHRNHAAELLC